jgi:CDP-paratose 2-epimerase
MNNIRQGGFEHKALITGGAGFIGANLARRLLDARWHVTILDNLSRKGTEKNMEWLSANASGGMEFVRGDISDCAVVGKAVRGVDVVYHLAAQVAVTNSVNDPRADFAVNALGTLNVLEAVRVYNPGAVVLYSSTNKVYGGMEDLRIEAEATRYSCPNLPDGVPESRTLDFHSPYGCSKGAADQYVRDYARIYGLNTVVFRQSCIYGPRQFGNEDQGWLAHFIIAAVVGRQITIYGDGKQVRDMLHVDDLINAFLAAVTNIGRCRGKIYNVGGGMPNAISVWQELLPILEHVHGKSIAARYSGWRPGDQPFYVSDIRKVEADLGWKPRIDIRRGVELLYEWVVDNRELF